MAQDQTFSFEDTFDQLYGLEIVEHDDGLIRGEVAVSNSVKQPADGPRRGLRVDGRVAGLDGDLVRRPRGRQGRDGPGERHELPAPDHEGTVHAEARVRHRGRTTWVWDVEITDDDGRLCALVAQTIAVRDRPR